MVFPFAAWYNGGVERSGFVKYKNTAELYYKYMLAAYSLLGAVWITLGLALLSIGGEENRGIGPALVFTACLYGAILVYELIQYLRFRNMLFTDVQEVKLERVTAGGFTRFVGFEIEVTRGGVKEQAAVKPVFHTSSLFGGLTLDKFAGRKYKVGFNEKSGEWVVLF